METVKFGQKQEMTHSGTLTPKTEAGIEDLKTVQKLIWGRLGY